MQSRHNSFKHAIRGLIYALKTQVNLRIHFVMALIVTLLGLLLKIQVWEWLIIIFTVSLVIITEMINTGIESIVDLITKKHNINAKIAKDVGAGMVLVSSIASVIIGIIIFAPYLLKLIN